MDISRASFDITSLPLITNPPAMRADGRPDDRFVWRKRHGAWIDHEERFVVQRMGDRRAEVVALAAEELVPLASDPRYEVGRCSREGVPAENGPLRVLFHECQSRSVIIDIAIESNMDSLAIRSRVVVHAATHRGAQASDVEPRFNRYCEDAWSDMYGFCCTGWAMGWMGWVLLGWVCLQSGVPPGFDGAIAPILVLMTYLVGGWSMLRWLYLNSLAGLKGTLDLPASVASFSDRVRQAIYAALDRAGVHHGMVTHTPKD